MLLVCAWKRAVGYNSADDNLARLRGLAAIFSLPREEETPVLRLSLTNEVSLFSYHCFSGAVSSVVEHYLDTVGVTGSNPVSRSVWIGFSRQIILKNQCESAPSVDQVGL
jgi:hypothetical protein